MLKLKDQALERKSDWTNGNKDKVII